MDDETKQFILDNIRGIRVIEEEYPLKFNAEKGAFDFEDEYENTDTVDFYFLCLECEEEFADLKAVVQHIPECEPTDEEYDDEEEFEEEEE